ncbi:hypothetical protein Tco_0829803, partial [Tanacetum coccineum]
RFLKNTGRKLNVMAMRLLILISPKWSATTSTRGDILLGSVELQEIKTTRTRKSQEGVYRDKAEEGPNYALMAFSFSNSNSEVSREITIRELKKKLEIVQKEKDSKKITESTVRRCISSKTTAWNEFSSTMASAIICLATNQKFTFSKYNFESMIRNLDNLFGKFLMYPRKPKIKDTQVPQPSDPSENVTDKAVHKELGDSLVRVATTASSLEVEQDSGNITKT